MSGRLVYTVYVTDDKGKAHTFGPADDKLPDWALGKIGAHAFEDGEHPKPSLLKKAAAAAPSGVVEAASDLQRRVSELEAENETLRADLAKYRGSESTGAVEVPPMGGAGSGVEAWRKYAEALGVEVDAAAKRDDIVDAVRAAGHPVEPVQQ